MGVSNELDHHQEATATPPPPSPPLYGDILELALSYVPLVDLVPASRVSRSWGHAVSFSLRHVNPPKPWLVVHTQSTRGGSTNATSTRAYDPRSRVWMELQHPPAEASSSRLHRRLSSVLRSSHSTLLYAISPSNLSFSSDPLNLMPWHHAASPPSAWRIDPVVALVGDSLVVAGGSCDFEDDPLAVEMYDLRTRAWAACDSMPAVLKDSSASTWLSIAVDGRRLYVMEKLSGATHLFDPETRTWRGPYDLLPDRDSCYYSVIAGGGDEGGRLIMVGLMGRAEDVKSVKMWEVRSVEATEIAEMPSKMVAGLKDDNDSVCSIGVCALGDYAYLYNPARPENVVWCEREDHDGRGRWRWGSVTNPAARERTGMERVVFTCARVGIRELREAVASGRGRFVVKEDPW